MLWFLVGYGINQIDYYIYTNAYNDAYADVNKQYPLRTYPSTVLLSGSEREFKAQSNAGRK